MRFFRYSAVCLFVFGINSASVAQQSCSTISDATKRLECFDKRESTRPAGAKKTGAPPTTDIFRAKIVQQKSTIWNDPYSIRGARIGERQTCPIGDRFPTGSLCVCVEANAKNAYGGYVGVRRTLMIFAPDGILTTSDGAILGYADFCQNMKPFPQLNGDGR